jgi:site-specific DNA-methyltransferase (adenine-specific)
MPKTGRPRLYPTNAERQTAYRARKRAKVLEQIPQVHGEGYSVYQGDALVIVPLLGAYDHVIADPPYDAQVHTVARRTRAVLEGRTPYAEIPFAPITAVQRRFFTRITCQWVLIFCQIEAAGTYEGLFGRQQYKRTCTWVKDDSTPQFTGDRPAQGTEHLVCAWLAPGRSAWNGGGKRGVYHYPVRDREQRVHPTQKPLALMRELVRDFTQPGDVVCDPFMGAATTGVASLELGRRFVGIEIDPGYFATACARLEATARQGQLFAPPPRWRQGGLFAS